MAAPFLPFSPWQAAQFCLIEGWEVENFVGAYDLGTGVRACRGYDCSRRRPCRPQTAEGTEYTQILRATSLIDSSSFLVVSSSLSRPARTAKGKARNCGVRTLTCRLTTNPQTRPNAICEMTNQGQLMRSLRIGLIMPSAEWRMPVHRNGAMKPAVRIGFLGNIGSMAP